MAVLRDYQQKCVESIFREWEEHTSTLAVLATGLGKTVCFSEVARRLLPKRSIIVAHRSELIHQAAYHLRQAGIEYEIEMAGYKANHSMFSSETVIVASVQTLISGIEEKRMTKFKPEDFGLLIWDEAHHCPSASYEMVTEYFSRNPALKILGVTATPDRADEEALGKIFQSVAFDYEINDGIDDGWLCDIEQQIVHVNGLDYSACRTTAGDLNGSDLAHIMEDERNLQGMAGATIDLVGTTKKTLVFTASVRQAEQCNNIFNRFHSGCSTWVHGEMPDAERKHNINDFRNGHVQILVNCAIACLDSETEILTRDGWKGHGNISNDDLIACWWNGRISFSPPLGIEVRKRRPDERMVRLETKNRSIRVTDDHRMVYSTSPHTREKILTAKELVGKQVFLPVSGNAFMEGSLVEQPAIPNTGRRIRANSYLLRKQGLSRSDAKIEAARRIKQSSELRRLNPSELTEDHCMWIGFWCGDGSRNHLQSGGIEYKICGSDQWPIISKWIEDVSRRCGFSFVKRRILPSKHGRLPLTSWSFCRGTGFGAQKKESGVFCIEPYLDKNGSDLIWSFSQKQFDAFMEGLWLADGNHGQGNKRVKSRIIYSSNKQFIDFIQAVACCRGYRCNYTISDNHGHVLYNLSFSKRRYHACTKYRLRFEDGWEDEIVWCVKSETGLIVTRRRGTVTITGNTEGFDVPGIEVVVLGRPTKSRALFSQMIGRGTRPLAHTVDGLDTPEERRNAIAASQKPRLIVLDFAGNSGRHKLISCADVLGGKHSDEVIELARRKTIKDGRTQSVTEALEEAEEEIREKIERAKRDAEARKAKLVARVQFTVQRVNPFDAFDLIPAKSRGWDQGKQLSEKQRGVLLKIGVNPETIPYVQGKQLVAEACRRWRDHLATAKQCALLKKYNFETKDMTMKEASAAISELAKNNWRRVEVAT